MIRCKQIDYLNYLLELGILMNRFDTIIIGAGLVGLAIARKMALSGRTILVLEANEKIGSETSFRNSAVIHAGIYYPSDSLKAKLCHHGSTLLYDYCATHNIPYKKVGKLIVATEDYQLGNLEKLYKQAITNGVIDIRIINQQEIQELEPKVKAVSAIYSPSTGIVHGYRLLMSYQADIESHNGIIKCNSQVTGVETLDNDFLVKIKNGCEFTADELINAAGLQAQTVAHSIKNLSKKTIPNTYYAKGNYFKFIGHEQPFSRLVYPLPEQAGLGIHATVDLSGAVRFGPDVEWVDTLDYTVNKSRITDFFKAICAYFPDLKIEELQPEFAGIRPKSQSKENQPQDFDIQFEKNHGIKNLINLYGIESPGLTASLAIAEYVFDELTAD